MTIEETFPTTSQQTMAQRIIQVLKNHPKSNSVQIVKYIWGKDKQFNCEGILYLLDGLQGLNAVTCEVIKRNPKERSRFFIDYFTLTGNAEVVLNQLSAMHKAPPYNPLDGNVFRYFVFRCGNCKYVIGTRINRNGQKSATCTYCNHKNLLDSVEVLLRTNDMYEMQSALQNAHQGK